MSYPEGKTSKHATVRIPKDLLTAIEKFLETKEAKEMGYIYITDIVTEAVREFLKTKGYYPLPRFEHFNLDENGVKILDRTDPQRKFYVQIYFKPTGMYCEYCNTDKCPHIKFALEQPDIQQIIRKKRQEGWKLPEPE